MVDPRDLGLVAQVRSPHAEQPTIYLYEAVPGGIGLSRAPVGPARRAPRGGGRVDRGVRLRRWLPVVHGSAARAGHRCPCPRATAPGRARGAAGRVRSPGGRMTSPVADRASLARRLDRYRATTHGGAGAPLEAARQVELPHAPVDRGVLAERLARTVGGEVVSMAGGPLRPLRRPSHARSRSIASAWPPCPASLRRASRSSAWTPRRPGSRRRPGPSPSSIGLGWWEGDAFHQVQLLLPDHADEPALLTALGRLHPARRLAGDLQRPGLRLAAARDSLPHGPPRRADPRRPPRPAAGRPPPLPPPDSRTRGCGRSSRACSGWSATATSMARRSPGATSVSCAAGRPSRSPRSSATTTRTSARWRACWSCSPAATGRRKRDGPRRPATSAAWPARTLGRDGSSEALECYDVAFEAEPGRPPPPAPRPTRCGRSTHDGRRNPPARSRGGRHASPADFGGSPRQHIGSAPSVRSAAFATPWTTDRIAVERAHLLRRLRRWDDAADAWASLAAGPGRTAIVAAIELAKLREHRLRDPLGALRATRRRPRPRRAATTSRPPGATTGGRPALPAPRRLRRRLVGRTATSARRADQRQPRVGGLP